MINEDYWWSLIFSNYAIRLVHHSKKGWTSWESLGDAANLPLGYGISVKSGANGPTVFIGASLSLAPSSGLPKMKIGTWWLSFWGLRVPFKPRELCISNTLQRWLTQLHQHLFRWVSRLVSLSLADQGIVPKGGCSIYPRWAIINFWKYDFNSLVFEGIRQCSTTSDHAVILLQTICWLLHIY